MVEAALAQGVVGRALDSKTLDLQLLNPRDFTDDVHRTVDDRPFGGGPGMILKPEPLQRCLTEAKRMAPYYEPRTVYFTPQGSVLDQSVVQKFAEESATILIAGRYEGIDERFIEKYVDLEISIGDFVLSGGELPALVFIDAVSRLLSGTLGNPASALNDSFSNDLLEYPQYTKPRIFEGKEVPDVLLSGDHARIAQWRKQQSLRRTYERRPDLLLKHRWSDEDSRLFSTIRDDVSPPNHIISEKKIP